MITNLQYGRIVNHDFDITGKAKFSFKIKIFLSLVRKKKKILTKDILIKEDADHLFVACSYLV